MRRLSLSLLAVAAFAALPMHSRAATCATAWNASTAYTAGQTASLNSTNYTANWWTQGQSPATNSGGSGSGQPWTSNGACTANSGGGSGSGGSGSGGGGTTTPPPSATGKLFAPYVDISLSADENLTGLQQQSGFKAVTLAFIVQANGCTAGWGGLGGTLPTDNFPNGTTVQSQVQALQSAGVQVIISFGGASGSEPAVGCTSATQLQALYQSVLDRYKVKMLDFDIEGSEETNSSANALRVQALKALKAANSGLVISYTLPVLPSGLDSNGLAIINGVKSGGLALDTVNIMAMDYGSAVPSGGMGSDAVSAAQDVHNQLTSAGLTSTYVGVTPMIGQNDSQGEIFSFNDAQTLLNFANGASYVDRLSMWSLARDNGGCANQTWASPTCSGLTQSSFQFTSTFKTY